ncbi:hypothetical protein CHLRE_10g447900v5 [Chlamydomonas reinhardtii]|uniref:Uncharacterized protein n=1 Tax=Chlamydomonas reinhardtii TaxID=3055 RepID=A0A2K3DAZ0_CHLRE|nr:uncharacterized protein CHLRE_10g447900v5 [Chlamydomonas reinhardtii]XP_042920312.1 uncharacterized protein CHLRE_10g447900v5 [Chlamydomonas reinhardtii]PNW77700.1 hypothetical protein CHLRE_10g447900v5 [Chlamydomonas reinhardtii]PNW77701.1 hypothetical protein CHLRE_10g447900v5 [Chlamydomonas reinhardtii]
MAAGAIKERHTWEELQTVIGSKDPEALGILGRSQEQLDIYIQQRTEILKEWASVGDSLRYRLFGSPTKLNEEGKLVVDSDNDHTARDCHIMVMRNEFGYFLDEGLEHINIWCSDRPLSAEVIEAIIRERLPCEDYLWFVNPPQYQSIKAIWHAHVMVKGLKEEGSHISAPGEVEILDPEKYLRAMQRQAEEGRAGRATPEDVHGADGR